jgi:ketosteroid isomerase-like protein
LSQAQQKRPLSPAELANEFWDAYNSGGTEAAIQYLASGVKGHSAPEWTGKALYEGHDGMRELSREWTESFEDYRWQPEHSIDVGDGRAVLLAHHSGRMRAGVPIEGKVAGVFTVEGDLIKEVRFFFTWEEALEAAGLKEIPS